MADTRTYQVDATQLAALDSYLAGHQIAFTLPTGSYNGNGWNLAWSLDNGSLTVTVIQHPFLEESAFWSRLENALIH
jgi:hypothetical protein